MLRLLGYYTCLGALGIALFQCISCAETSNVTHSEQPLILLYSAKKERFTGIDPEGNATMSHYNGRKIVVHAIITDVNLTKDNPSVVMENDTAKFTVDGDQKVPGHPNTRFIELRFDENALFEPKPFAKGEPWEFTLTEEGDLVDLRPAPPSP